MLGFLRCGRCGYLFLWSCSNERSFSERRSSVSRFGVLQCSEMHFIIFPMQ
jgi:hypothetical protein